MSETQSPETRCPAEPGLPVSPTRSRRTQGARSAATRKKLLDATLEVLLERGYGGTSTLEVCQRAGMSRGALLYHFPTKAQLVVESVRRFPVIAGPSISPPDGPQGQDGDPIHRLCERLWSAFSRPAAQAGLELWLAARTDRELRAALEPLERALRGELERLFHGLPGFDLADSDLVARLRDLAMLTVHVLRGMAWQRTVLPQEAERRRLFGLWKRMVAHELSALGAGR